MSNWYCKELKIHPTAIIHPDAKLGVNIEVGPFSLIGPGVIIGNNCSISSHVVIDGFTRIGNNNRIFNGASIGLEPQDMKYKGEKSSVLIGDDNIFREYVTVNRGTSGGGGETRIGSGNLIMAYTHIAHDCSIGNKVIIANAVNMAGHVVIDDQAVIGGATGIVQYVRIGRMAMTGGSSKATKDVPPYVILDGNPGRIRSINLIGMERNGVCRETIAEIKKAFKLLYRSNLTTRTAVSRIAGECGGSPEIEELLQFIRRSSKGVAR